MTHKNKETKTIEEKEQEKILKKAQRPPQEQKWMFRYGHPYKVKWDILVMSFAAWNTVQIPIEVAYEPSEFDNKYLYWFNNFIDFIFFVDILVNFRSAYINQKTGEEVRGSCAVAYNYLTTRFMIDLLATIPFDQIAGMFFDSDSVFFQLFGLLKLVRVLRLARIVTFLNL